MEVGQVGHLGPHLPALVVQMLLNAAVSQGQDPAPVQHQRMEEMIALKKMMKMSRGNSLMTDC